MATIIDRLVVELGLDPKAFTKGQKEAAAALIKTRQQAEKEAKAMERSLDGATDAIERLARNALKLFAIFTAGRAIKSFVSDMTGADAALGRLATRIGQAPGDISAMATAVTRAGGSFDAAANSFQSFSDNIQQIRTTGDSSILPFLARVQAAGGKTINLNKDISETFIDLADNLKAVREKGGDAQANYLGRQLGLDEGTVALLVRGGAAVRSYLEQSRRLGVATKADTEAAQSLQTTWRSLTQASEGLGRTILTAVTPTITDLLKRLQEWIEANREWIRTEIVANVKEFAKFLREIDWKAIGDGIKTFVSSANSAAQAVGGWLKVCEALFAIWLGSKFIAVLRAIGLFRVAMLGGGGLLGGVFKGLAIGGTIGADAITPNAEKPGLQKHWDDEASGAAPGGMWDAVRRGWNWGKRKLFGGGSASAAPGTGGGSVSALPVAPGTGDGHVASREERAKYIREAAVRNGIDPEVALRVAQSEGFNKYTGDQGRSHGDWQLFTGGGLGNKALAEGIDVRDPKTWKEQTDFALREAARGGWGPWHGAAKAGIGDWQGITRKGPQADGPAPVARNDGVDARLTDIIENAKKSLPEGYTAKIVSGLRPGDRRFHGQGLASDVAIYDPQGRKLGNYQDASTFRQYEQFAQAARRYQMQKYPELAKALRWGGYFGGPAGKYGAMDTMHFDLGGHRVGMGGGSWSDGLTREQRQLFPGANSQGMGQDAPRSPSAQWWRGSPNAMASVNQARDAQAAQIGRQMNDNRSTSTTTNSTRIGSVTVQTAATDANGIARDMEDALKRRSFVAAATTGQA